MRMQPELKTKELEKKVIITVITVLKILLDIFFKSSFLYHVILGTVSKEKLLYPKQKSTRGGVWLQEMQLRF